MKNLLPAAILCIEQHDVIRAVAKKAGRKDRDRDMIYIASFIFCEAIDAYITP